MVSVARTVATQVEDTVDARAEGETRRVELVGNLPFELQLALASNGVSVVDGGEGLEVVAILVAEGSPDVVAEQVARGLPVLATCAGDDMESLSALARAGAADILTHPLVIDDLIRKLDRALKRARRRD